MIASAGSRYTYSANTLAYQELTKDDERIDYEEIMTLAQQCKPKFIMAGATVYPRLWDFERMRYGERLWQDRINARWDRPTREVHRGFLEELERQLSGLRGRRLVLMQSLFWPASDTLCQAQMLGGFLIGALMTMRGQMTLGDSLDALGATSDGVSSKSRWLCR